MGGSSDLIERLLNDQEMGHLNVKDVNGWTPLHWACRSADNAEVVRLLKHGTGFRQPTHDAWTPENISFFHDAKDLLPIMNLTLADSSQSNNSDKLDANEASTTAKNWKTGSVDGRAVCYDCQQQVSQTLSYASSIFEALF